MNPAESLLESQMNSVATKQFGQDPNDGSDLGDDDFNPELLDEDETLAIIRCPLCLEVITEATRVTKCKDLFCSECIRGYLLEDGNQSCPCCTIDLGPNPEEYLQFDQAMFECLFSMVQYFQLRRERDVLLARKDHLMKTMARCQCLPRERSVLLMRKQLSLATPEAAARAPDGADSEGDNKPNGKKNNKDGQKK